MYSIELAMNCNRNVQSFPAFLKKYISFREKGTRAATFIRISPEKALFTRELGVITETTGPSLLMIITVKFQSPACGHRMDCFHVWKEKKMKKGVLKSGLKRVLFSLKWNVYYSFSRHVFHVEHDYLTYIFSLCLHLRTGWAVLLNF